MQLRLLLATVVAAAAATFGAATLTARLGSDGAARFASGEDARAALERAQAQARAAAQRGERLEEDARRATEAAERTANEAAALAARIQQAEADIAATEARLELIGNQRAALRERLGERREPLVRLTGGLQRMARRPLALSVLQPGSVRETVYLRALLATTIPQVHARTAALREEIARGQALERQARASIASLRAGESVLDQRRQRLAAIETRQQLAARRASGDAARETDLALALAEEARDLDSLVEELDGIAGLRDELAALPGPVLRPGSQGAGRASDGGTSTPTGSGVTQSQPTPATAVAARRFQLPVAGRTLTGFGEDGGDGRSTGLVLSPRGGAQVVAPGAGRVAFAGPYRGFGAIVIIEHPGNWTSLVTGLARTDVEVGTQVVEGAPLGVAAQEAPEVMLELRRDGEPVNPLNFVR